jgi:hypothetical protein
MRRFTPNENGVIPAHELSKVFSAKTGLIDANTSARDALLPERKKELAKAPADRANHPGRVVHDPWASDPAGPNEALNASQAREVMNDNADSIYREHGIHPHDYTDEDIAGYKAASEEAQNNPDNTPPF